MGLTMYDTVTVDTVPKDAKYVAGYVSGSWPTYQPLLSSFATAHVMSIAPEANWDADCLDVEPLDATNAQAADWFRRQKARNLLMPVFYTSASNVNALVAMLASGGVQRDQYLIWSAHYTYSPHICSPNICGYPQADGTQWTDHALGRNLDQSLLKDDFFGPPPPPPDPHQYHRFPDVPFPYYGHTLYERQVVKEYDKLRAEQTWRKHPHRQRLAVLRTELQFLRDRVCYLAEKHAVPPAKFNWDLNDFGWRRKQLEKRAKGKRVV